MITDTFIEYIRSAFATFGIAEEVSRFGLQAVQAGRIRIAGQEAPSALDEDTFCVYYVDAAGVFYLLAEVHNTLPYTAVIAAVEWHQNNPRTEKENLPALVETVAS